MWKKDENGDTKSQKTSADAQKRMNADRQMEDSEPEISSAQEKNTRTQEAKTADSQSFSELKQVLGTFLKDESAFGKSMHSLPDPLQKELRKSFPRLNFDTFLCGSKVGNGCLLFSTSAMYLKNGLGPKSGYVRVPYQTIRTEKLATACGKTKGTRKLLIPFEENGEEAVLTVEDGRLTEEKLEALLKEIKSSGCKTAASDLNVYLPELPRREQMLYFRALGKLLVHEGRSLTELYLIVNEYGLGEDWNELASSFSEYDSLADTVREFQAGVPYPSERVISQQAVVLALQTLFRTNRLENKEPSLLSLEMETGIRLFFIDEVSEKQFNEIMTAAAESKRAANVQICYDLKERLPQGTLYRGEILSCLENLIGLSDHTDRDKKSTLTDTVRDAAKGLPEAKGKLRNAAGRLIRKNDREEIIRLPSAYQKLKEKMPEDIGIPQNAAAYAMNTDRASALLLMFPVTEEQSMPFGDPQRVIEQMHQHMGEDEGLIEVVNGTTKAGRKIIYEILKHRMPADDGLPPLVEYTLNLNLRMEKTIQFINASFSEEGMTGTRESIGMALYARENDMTMDQVRENWTRDPYDPTYKRGFLMNLSEDAKLDEQFPHHPLSEARALVRFIVEHN